MSRLRAISGLCALVVFCTMMPSILAQSPCGWTDTNGNKYDVSALTKSTGTDYSVVGGGQTYNINVCKATVAGCDTATAGICQIDNHGAKWSAGAVPGTFSQGAATVGKGLTLTYSGGDTCLGTTRTSVVQFNCDDTKGPGAPSFVSENPPCTYNFAWDSAYACVGAGPAPGGGGFTGGWVFVTIYLVGFTLYCIGGVIYKWQKMGATGKEMIPNIDFWGDLPNLVKDGFKFIISGCRKSGYSESV